MLKLIKYELIHSYRSFALVFGVFLLACFLVPIFPFEVSTIGIVLLTLAFFGIFISVFVTIIINYNSSMFKKPGYLTLTLPVSSHQLVISKILASSLWVLIASIISVLGIFIMVMVSVNKVMLLVSINDVVDGLLLIAKEVGGTNFFFGIVRGLFSIIASITSFFALVTIVQTKYTRKHKVAIAFIIAIIYSFIAGSITSSLLPDMFTMSYIDTTKYLWIPTIIDVVLTIIEYFIIIYILEKQVEVE